MTTAGTSYRVATDTGGTFTDFVVFDELANDYTIVKVPSTPDDPSRAVVDGLEVLRARGIRPDRIRVFMHGTTVGTNALLEERGARTGLAITSGFRGIYETMEQSRPFGPAVFDLGYTKPAMLVPQSRTVEVAERVTFTGEERVPLSDEAINDAVAGLEAAGVDAVAICFLFSFMNSEHESRLAEALRQAHPEWFVTTSAELLPQLREYYRLSTTVINAYVSPVLAKYVARLSDELDAREVAPARRFTMQSNGGSAPFGKTAERGVSTILSGPAGGVTAAIGLGKITGRDNIITFDMGGTSCDVALIRHGFALVSDHNTVDGRHLAVPMLDINTVSAGGGTIARVDDGGGLRVGPRSAGAVPGPAAYGHGGSEATVTDADVVLGYLNPAWLLDGDLPVDAAAAHRAIERVADGLGVSSLRAADGIVRVVNIKMAEAIRAISTERGFDLREFCLIPFGGAGPLHACQIAIDLGIPTVVVPATPGATSALGLLMSDVRHDFVRSKLSPLADLDAETANQLFEEMSAAARSQLASEGFTEEQTRLEYFLDMRYAGQGYENAVRVETLPLVAQDLARYRQVFDEVHRQFHGHAAPDQPVEVVSYRTVATGELPDVRLARMPAVETPIEEAIAGTRAAYFPSASKEPVEVVVYARRRLRPGHRFDGPAIVEQYDATTVVCPEQTVAVDDFGNLIITGSRI
jgi:N-methylhydantoinase A